MNAKIIELIRERLELGAKKYGHENIISDDRDFIQESLEEVLDCMVYAACKLLEIKEYNKYNEYSMTHTAHRDDDKEKSNEKNT